MSHFDWYAGSFRGEHGPIVGAVLERLEAHVERQEKGKNGFKEALRIRGDRGLHSVVSFGGHLHRDLVHVAFSGGRSGDGASLLREIEPEHRISRVDVAEDVCCPGAFHALHKLSARISRAHHVGRTRVVPDDRVKGQTVYLGSRSSPCYVRIYEKGKQVLAGGHHVDVDGLREDINLNNITDWVRCELELKPKSSGREGLSHLEPDAYWGASAWTRDLAQAITGDDYAKVRVGTVWKASDQERTLHALLNQYGKFLEGLALDLGSWECAGLQLRDELQELRRRQALGCGGE